MAGLFKTLFSGKQHVRDDKAARAEIAAKLREDPKAWAYVACEQDEDTCETCLHTAGVLRHVKLNDPRLMIMLRGHPDCSSPRGCRCEIRLVGGDEYDPDAEPEPEAEAAPKTSEPDAE